MSPFTRRDSIALMAAGGAAAVAGCTPKRAAEESKTVTATPPILHRDVVEATVPLRGFPWPTRDPFLFCVHHDDAYPVGNAHFGPATSLAGRNIGMDFEGKDGWRMYHGDVVPGFPQHPHRGFETVTVVRRGLLDHSDSLGAAARYGQGDVQWLTAGKGILHAEMFPLLSAEKPNPVELFQIWLNLPARNKMVDPHFTMLWAPDIPKVVEKDAAGRETHVQVFAGSYGEHRPPAPPPNSWAAQPGADVAIWSIRLAPDATWTLPAAAEGTHRSLYLFEGGPLSVGGTTVAQDHRADVTAHKASRLEAGPEGAELLLLQGRPIGEPVAHHGPFVMNTRAELQQAYQDYRRTQFGGWPWDRHDPVHGPKPERFARRPDGKTEKPT